MELTGKCKEDFLNFFKKKYYPDELEDVVVLQYFDNKELVEKQALILEFFDSVGIFINTPPYYMKVEKYNRGFESIVIDEKSSEIHDLDNDEDVFNTRLEATTEAIKKANEIYNQNK